MRLFLEGAVLTFDAMGCQREVAASCRDVGAHWGVENRILEVLDVVFGEDYCRARSGFAPENLSALRKLVLTLLRRNGLPGKGVKVMQLECAWDFDQAVKVMFGGEPEEVR